MRPCPATLFAIIACCLCGPVAAAAQVSAHAFSVRPLPSVLQVEQVRSRHETDAGGLIQEAVASRSRPKWLLPLAGAAVGAGVMALTIEDRCAEDDCMVSIPPYLTGALAGALIGVVVELAL